MSDDVKRDESIEDEYRPQFLGEFGEGRETRIRFKTIKEIPIIKFAAFDYDFDEEIFQPYSLDLSKRALTDIYPLKIFPQLTYLRLGSNKLTNASLEALNYLQNLVSLYLDRNLIESTRLPKLPKLQQLNLERNPIEEIDPIHQPNLEILILNHTKISVLQNIGKKSTPKLTTLSATHCQLTSMVADYTLTMKHLYLANNKITRIEGLEGLINLRKLHLRNNKVSVLTGLTVGLVRLEYINLRENNVSDVNDLKQIQTLPSLREFIINDNPVFYEMGSDIRPMTMMYSLQLKRIDKELTDQEDELYARSLIYEVEEEEDNLFRGEELDEEEYYPSE